MPPAFHASYATGRFTASAKDVVVRPTAPVADLPPVINLAGLGADAAGLLGWVAECQMTASIARAGFHIVAPTVQAALAGDGVVPTDQRIDDAVAWARANLPVSLEPPLLYGASHGTTCALCYAADHPVSGVMLMLPCVDMQFHITNDTNGIRAGVNAAWGRSAGDTSTLPAGANPAVMTTQLAQVPQVIYSSTEASDAVSTNVATYASAVGANMQFVGSAGHVEATIAAIPRPDVVRFMGHHSRRRNLVDYAA